MAELTHETIMNIVRASLDPAGHHLRARPGDLPVGRLIAAEARKDTVRPDAERLVRLGTGLVRAASVLTLELLAHDETDCEEHLAEMSRSADEEGLRAGQLIAEVASGMLRGQGGTSIEAVLRTFARDRAEYLELLPELAAACGMLIMFLKVRFDVPVEETLANLEKTLRNDGE